MKEWGITNHATIAAAFQPTQAAIEILETDRPTVQASVKEAGIVKRTAIAQCMRGELIMQRKGMRSAIAKRKAGARN